jgi:hypothetical protein
VCDVVWWLTLACLLDDASGLILRAQQLFNAVLLHDERLQEIE